MADRRCDNCGAERGADGPCPGCGALPAVQLVELDQQAPGEVRRATTADAPQRRVALGVVLVLVALVAGSIVWDLVRTDADEAAGDAAGADEADEDDGADDDDGADGDDEDTPSTTRPPVTPTSPPASDGAEDDHGAGTVSVAPLEDFEDRWLLVVNQDSGAVWQLPLGGGEVTSILGRSNRPLVHSMPPWFRVVGDALVGRGGSVSLVDGDWWSFQDNPDDSWLYPVGITEDETLVFVGDTLTERTPMGELLSERGDLGQSRLMGTGRWVTDVAGRSVIVSGPHGVYAVDLDSEQARLLLDGSFIAANGELVVGQTCTGWQECAVEVVEIDGGAVVSAFEHDDLLPGRMPFPGALMTEPELSPDGERLLVVVDERIEMVDLTSGDRLGSFDLPTTEDGPSPSALGQVIWAPDSSAALIYVDTGLFSGSSVAPLLLRVDRNLSAVEPLDQLLDAIHTNADRGLAIVLSDRPFEPVPEG